MSSGEAAQALAKLAATRLRQDSIDMGALEAAMADGGSHAAVMSDYQVATDLKVIGSPTYILNEGRQKLYGKVGYRVLAANIDELLREPSIDQASWC